jgi:hypothetical protein
MIEVSAGEWVGWAMSPRWWKQVCYRSGGSWDCTTSSVRPAANGWPAQRSGGAKAALSAADIIEALQKLRRFKNGGDLAPGAGGFHRWLVRPC